MCDAFLLGRDCHIVLVNAGEIAVRVGGTEECLILELDVF